MNVLVLTPDRVGSTLLQRLLTIYMVKKGFGKPVINLHELSNGIIKYYNTTLREYVLGKPQKDQWNYNQSLAEVINLLSSVDHFKTSRLAHYHLKARKDSPDDLEQFYQYLNENFYIISCRRTNLFEQALSWSIVAHSKQLNVYDPRSKFDTFNDIYHHGIVIGKDVFIDNLNAYQDYLIWADQNFDIKSYFVYDEHVHDVESYIAKLDFMQGTVPTWKQMFGQDFKSYNTCHKLLPDLAIQQSTVARLSFDTSKIKNYPLSKVSVDQNQHAFLQKNLDAYLAATDHIAALVNTGYLITGIPIKLQSLAEKRAIVTNFQECVLWYNIWCKANGIDCLYSDKTLLELADQETQKMVVVEGLEPPPDSV